MFSALHLLQLHSLVNQERPEQHLKDRSDPDKQQPELLPKIELRLAGRFPGHAPLGLRAVTVAGGAGGPAAGRRGFPRRGSTEGGLIGL